VKRKKIKDEPDGDIQAWVLHTIPRIVKSPIFFVAFGTVFLIGRACVNDFAERRSMKKMYLRIRILKSTKRAPLVRRNRHRPFA
jgi:hypothetical protein